MSRGQRVPQRKDTICGSMFEDEETNKQAQLKGLGAFLGLLLPEVFHFVTAF